MSVVLVSPGVSPLERKGPPGTIPFLVGGEAQAANARHKRSLAPRGLACGVVAGAGSALPERLACPARCRQCLLPPARMLRHEEPDCCASLSEEAIIGLLERQPYQDIGAMTVFVEVGLVASAAPLRAGGGKLGCAHEAEGRGEAARALCGPCCLPPGL